MSEPWTEPPIATQAAGAQATATGAPMGGALALPKTLLEQMQELLASISTDLAGLDSDLRSSGARADGPAEPTGSTEQAEPTERPVRG